MYVCYNTAAARRSFWVPKGTDNHTRIKQNGWDWIWFLSSMGSRRELWTNIQSYWQLA